ncbi:MAG: glycosyltransferase family 2 protein [Candidatus Zixiibacteriota bacterium]
MSQQYNSVSTVIVTYNSQDCLPECLLSLRESVATVPHHLIVVDNDSDIDPGEQVRSVFPDATLIQNRNNEGFARGCNAGAAEAEGDYLLFVNPDVILDADCVAKLIEAAEQSEEPGMLGARLRYPDGTFQPSARNFPTVGNLLFSRGSFLTRAIGHAPGRSDRYTLPDFEQTTAVAAVAGTLVLIRRETYLEVGGFDSDFFMFMEDTDLCFRLHSRGYTNFFVPEAGAVHRWGRGGTAGKTRRAWYHHRSLLKYFHKHQPGPFSWVVFPFLLALNFGLALALPERRGEKEQQA